MVTFHSYVEQTEDMYNMYIQYKISVYIYIIQYIY